MPYLTISLSFISRVGGGMECCDQCFILPSLSALLVALIVVWDVCCAQCFILPSISASLVALVVAWNVCCDQCFILPSLSTSLVALVVAWNVCCDQWFLLLAGEEVGEQKDDSGLFLPEISEIKRREKKD